MPSSPTVRKTSNGNIYVHQPVNVTGPGAESPRRLTYVKDNHHEFVRNFYDQEGEKRFGRLPMTYALPGETLPNILAEIHKEPWGIRMRAHNKWAAHLEGLDNTVRIHMNAGPGEDRFTVKRNLYRLSPEKIGLGNIVGESPDYGLTLDKEAHDYFSTLRTPIFGSGGIRATFSLNPVQWARNFNTSARMRQMVREATFMAYLKTGNLRFAKQVYKDMLQSTKYKNEAGVTARDFLMKHAGRADTTFQRIYQSIKYTPAYQLQAAVAGSTSNHGRENPSGPELQSDETQAERRRQNSDDDIKEDIKYGSVYFCSEEAFRAENHLAKKLSVSDFPASLIPRDDDNCYEDPEDRPKDKRGPS